MINFKKPIIFILEIFSTFLIVSCSNISSISSSNGDSDNFFQFDTLMNPGDEERCIYKYSNDEVVERKVSYYKR